MIDHALDSNNGLPFNSALVEKNTESPNQTDEYTQALKTINRNSGLREDERIKFLEKQMTILERCSLYLSRYPINSDKALEDFVWALEELNNDIRIVKDLLLNSKVILGTLKGDELLNRILITTMKLDRNAEGYVSLTHGQKVYLRKLLGILVTKKNYLMPGRISWKLEA